ncbi:glucosamine-6-phosphate deaminase [Cutibacterium acnes JCM 18916]|nr:glucosamine-6-phosphate deaminase [Cutibacterium acnes JCM 18916]
MEVIICSDEQAVGRIAADRIAKVLGRAKAPVLGVATGSTPLTTYSSLAALAAEGKADFTDLRAFALDEYIGLPADDERSYAATIRHTVTEQLGLDPANVHTPDGMADDLDAACAAYETAIQEADGVDVQILGIGANGHIGFNEPPVRCLRALASRPLRSAQRLTMPASLRRGRRSRVTASPRGSVPSWTLAMLCCWPSEPTRLTRWQGLSRGLFRRCARRRCCSSTPMFW